MLRSRRRPFRSLTVDHLEDRTLLSTASLLSLTTPAPSSDEVIPVTVSTTLPDANLVLIDVDLNHDGRFAGAGELGYTRANLVGSTTVNLHGLVDGTYSVRARLDGQPIASATRTLQVLPAPANQLPVSFEPNQGQTAGDVLFVGRAQDQTVFITATDTVLVSPSGESVRFRLTGANPDALPQAGQVLPGRTSYFLGNDADAWRTDIANYRSVVRHDVYPGIDLVYHSRQNRLEYDFHVAAGADPANIALEFPEAAGLSIDADGSLLIHVPGTADLRKAAPVMYQRIGGVTQAIRGDWILKGPNVAGYEVTAYDRRHELVIDPIVFSTYLGGTSDENKVATAFDSAGNIVIAGVTSSSNFPTRNGFDSTYNTGRDIFVTKMDPTGTNIIYSTFLGGSRDDGTFWAQSVAVAVNSLDQVIVSSDTASTDYPTLNPIQASMAGTWDVGLTILNAAGNALVYSTYFGGVGVEYGISLTTDAADNIYLAGNAENPDFPVTAGAYQTTWGGGTFGDAYVAKFTPTGAVVWCTFIGGSEMDGIRNIKLDAAGNIVFAGETLSSDYPVTAGAAQSTYGGGGRDGHLGVLNAAGTAILYWTYLGGSDRDVCWDLDVVGGFAYFAGETRSPNISTTAGSVQTTYGGGLSDSFVAKINLTTTAVSYITYLGGTGGDIARGITADAAGNAYLAGYTASDNFPTVNPIQATHAGSGDAYVAKLNPSGSTMLFSTFLGGNSTDFANDLLLDADGSLIVSGDTGSVTGTFPITAGVIQTTYGGGYDSFITRIALAGLTVVPSGGSTSVTEGGTTDTYTVVLNTPPTANVTVTLGGGPQLTVSTPTLTFTPANWSTPQTVTVTAVDDAAVEGVHTGVVTHSTASSDANYNSLSVPLTAGITDNDSGSSAGVTVTQSAGSTGVAEGGATDTYTIVLAAAPTANVTISANSGAQLTTTPASLVFTPSNWSTPQTVTVRAVDDAAIEGAHNGVISHAITTSDNNYRSLSVAAVTAAIADNDSGTIRLSPAGPISILEGNSRTYTVSLTTAPSQNVTVTLTPDAGLVVAPLTLTFTPGNWNAPQTVNVSYPNNSTADGNLSLQIAHDVTGDPAFVGPGPDMTVNVVDDDSTLLVHGTEKADRIGVIFSTKQIQVVVNGKSKIYAPTFSQVLVQAYAGNDTIQFTNPTIAGSVFAGTGIDKLTIDGQSAANNFAIDASAVTVNGRLVSLGEVESVQLTGKTLGDTFVVTALPTYSLTLLGNSGPDSLTLPDQANTLKITASDTGSLGPIAFIGVENLTGGSDDDTFLFAATGKLNGKIDGAAGANILDFSACKAAVTANLQLGTITGTKGFRNIGAINAGLAATDKLIAANASNTWNLSAINAGDVGGLSFQSFENLTGGTLDDVFVLTEGQWIKGKIDGGAGVDALDHSSFAATVIVNLQAKTATGTGGFLGIEDFRGGSGMDRLIGANRTNIWNITGSGAGAVSGTLFTAFETLTGGSVTDLFDVASTGDWLDLLDGGLGLDTLVANGGAYTTTGPGAGTLNGHNFRGIETRR